MFRDQAKFPFKRRIYPVVLTALVFTILMMACGSKKRPADVLSEPAMTKALIEMYLAESKAGRAGLSYDSIKQIFPAMEAKVFEKVSTTDSVFRKSMQYYFAHPDKLERIYAAVVDSLNLRSQSAAPIKLAE